MSAPGPSDTPSRGNVHFGYSRIEDDSIEVFSKFLLALETATLLPPHHPNVGHKHKSLEFPVLCITSLVLFRGIG